MADQPLPRVNWGDVVGVAARMITEKGLANLSLADLAARRGESGPMPHLACFFKQPLDTKEHNLHRQWQLLVDYLEAVRADQRR